MQPRPRGRAECGLRPAQLHRVFDGGDGRAAGTCRFRAHDQQRLAGGEVPGPLAGSGQVLDVVEAARALLFVQEPAVPLRVVAVGAVAGHHHRGDPGIGLPAQPGLGVRGQEPEGRVLVMQRVHVAAGEERTHRQPRGLALQQPPGDHDGRLPSRHEQLLLDGGAVVQPPLPGRPGLRREAVQTAPAGIRMGDSGPIPLTAERVRPRGRGDGRIEAVHQHEPGGGGTRGRQQDGVIATGAEATHGPAGEAAQAVGFQPLGPGVDGEGHRGAAALRPSWG
jgi:hypothetical protein